MTAIVSVSRGIMVRAVSLILLGGLVASCTTTSPPPTRSAKAEQQYQQLIAGKVAQPSVTCLPSYNANDMITIDGRTLAFRVGSARTYIMHLSPGCEQASTGNYAFLSRPVGG